MRGLWTRFLDWARSLFWKQEMELTLIGLQNAGKTTLVNVISSGGGGGGSSGGSGGAPGAVMEDTIPTVGFNMRRVTKGRVTIKFWDIGGQPRFRSMWERYCRNVNSIVYVMDSADQPSFESAKAELHDLINKPGLQGIPLLVLGNKNDLPGALTVKQVIEIMELESIKGREVCCYSISAKNQVNIDITLDWLIKHSKKSPPPPALSTSVSASSATRVGVAATNGPQASTSSSSTASTVA